MSVAIIAFLVVFALFALLRNSNASSRHACPICKRYFVPEYEGQRTCSLEHKAALDKRSKDRQAILGIVGLGGLIAAGIVVVLVAVSGNSAPDVSTAPASESYEPGEATIEGDCVVVNGNRLCEAAP